MAPRALVLSPNSTFSSGKNSSLSDVFVLLFLNQAIDLKSVVNPKYLAVYHVRLLMMII